MTTDDLVAEFGEKYRKLIENAIAWLDRMEPVWGVMIDREQYIAELIVNVRMPGDVPCPNCDESSGWVAVNGIAQRCEECHGTGKVLITA